MLMKNKNKIPNKILKKKIIKWTNNKIKNLYNKNK